MFSPGTPVSSTNKTDRHDIYEILSKVVLNTITLTPTLETLFSLLICPGTGVKLIAFPRTSQGD
jgi:hypothetical protein